MSCSQGAPRLPQGPLVSSQGAGVFSVPGLEGVGSTALRRTGLSGSSLLTLHVPAFWTLAYPLNELFLCAPMTFVCIGSSVRSLSL